MCGCLSCKLLMNEGVYIKGWYRKLTIRKTSLDILELVENGILIVFNAFVVETERQMVKDNREEYKY